MAAAVLAVPTFYIRPLSTPVPAFAQASVVGGGIFLKLIKPIPRIVFSDKICIFQKSTGAYPTKLFSCYQV